ncbi:MAG: LptF/LptG family permease [Holosporales bacterium]|jgi:lipopolysaccharide export system permease protein|nr:LptF/LptG family permease [Holosporales bacterium]
MGSIIFNYILKKLITSLFIISPIVIMMVWITASIKYIGLIVTNDISITSFFELILCVLPDIAGTTFPICALISCLLVFYKMQTEKEIIVFMSSGKSKPSISSSLFIFSAFVASLVFVFQTMLIPYSYKKLTNIQEQIRNQISMSVVKPGTFNAVGDSIIYIREKTENSLNDVFISYIPKNKKNYVNIITAKSGKYSIKNNDLLIKLDNGYRQELDENNNVISILKFENFSYDVSEFVKNFSKKIRKIHEKTQNELIQEAKNTEDISVKNKCIAEYHRRIILPFIAIINAIIISIFMINPNSKLSHGFHAFKAFFCGLICQICMMTMANTSAKYVHLIPFNYLAIIITCLILLFFSFKRKIL